MIPGFSDDFSRSKAFLKPPYIGLSLPTKIANGVNDNVEYIKIRGPAIGVNLTFSTFPQTTPI